MAVTDEQERQLVAAEKNAHANRTTDVRILSAAEIREREPNASLDVHGGLLVPGESLGDPFMASIAYAEVALANGVDILLGTGIAGVELGQAPGAPLHHLVTDDGHRLPARRIVNAASAPGAAAPDFGKGCSMHLIWRAVAHVAYFKILPVGGSKRVKFAACLPSHQFEELYWSF